MERQVYMTRPSDMYGECDNILQYISESTTQQNSNYALTALLIDSVRNILSYDHENRANCSVYAPILSAYRRVQKSNKISILTFIATDADGRRCYVMNLYECAMHAVWKLCKSLHEHDCRTTFDEPTLLVSLSPTPVVYESDCGPAKFLKIISDSLMTIVMANKQDFVHLMLNYIKQKKLPGLYTSSFVNYIAGSFYNCDLKSAYYDIIRMIESEIERMIIKIANHYEFITDNPQFGSSDFNELVTHHNLISIKKLYDAKYVVDTMANSTSVECMTSEHVYDMIIPSLEYSYDIENDIDPIEYIRNIFE